ncbi:MAG: hypothetical protein C0478_06685 [Planctomyces sp.]|nr:hypothetical protein [Planctomyces sp.]
MPDLHPVTGTVTLNDKPAAGVLVRFIPKSGTLGDGGNGLTDQDGRFSLTYRGEKAGVPAGEYAVAFSKFAMPDGSSVSPDIQPESVGAKQVIPARYTSGERSGYLASVSKGSNNFDYSLKSK